MPLSDEGVLHLPLYIRPAGAGDGEEGAVSAVMLSPGPFPSLL